MFSEHDRIVLSAPLPRLQLVPGDVGTIVHVYRDGQAYEVEFVMVDGRTAAVATVEASQVRRVGPHDITRARGRERTE
jgi:ATP-dependent exoDNAse (exonuclease V) alpha subunit